MSSYSQFLSNKDPVQNVCGFDPLWLPGFLFPFQSRLVDWAVRLGRSALFADTGLGKTPQQLVWAENIVRKTNKRVLVLTPLAVAPQTIREAGKFGVQAKRTKRGELHKGINVTNYQRLAKYSPSDFTGVVCDESSCLKHHDTKTRQHVTEFLSKVEYRLLCTATPAPNDFMELGSSSESLGIMGRNVMLRMFFTNDGESTKGWRLKGHAKKRFWQWMATWARAVRKPSDLGEEFSDEGFILPPLTVEQHRVKSRIREGFLPPLARTLSEQRREKRDSLQLRCEKAAEVLPTDRPCVAWCQLNSEGDLLAKLLPDAVQVAGKDSDDEKEEKLNAFSLGQIRVLVTKPSIACFGLNWQHCADVSYFPDHSHERYYQAIRRCWRFGQARPVACHMVYSEAESLVLSNLLRKEKLSDEMYSGILRHMAEFQLGRREQQNGRVSMRIPRWLA